MTNNQSPEFGCGGGSAPPPPPQTSSPTPAAPVSNAPQTNIFIQIRLDDYPQEIGWSIVDTSTGALVVQHRPGSYFVTGSIVQEIVSVNEGGSYVLDLKDQAGDGICCEYGFGEAAIFLGNNADPLKELQSTDGRYLEGAKLPFVASFSGIGSDPTPSIGLFTVRFLTDSYPEESYWDIRTMNDEVVWYAHLDGWSPGEEVTYVVELNLGETYTFYVFDEQNDGLCKCIG